MAISAAQQKPRPPAWQLPSTAAITTCGSAEISAKRWPVRPRQRSFQTVPRPLARSDPLRRMAPRPLERL
jgi:hypothetical protein